MDDDGLDIGGMKLPKWALYIGGVAVLLLLALNRGKSGTGTSDAAVDYTTALEEQWTRWQAWADEFVALEDEKLDEERAVKYYITPPGFTPDSGPAPTVVKVKNPLDIDWENRFTPLNTPTVPPDYYGYNGDRPERIPNGN